MNMSLRREFANTYKATRARIESSGVPDVPIYLQSPKAEQRRPNPIVICNLPQHDSHIRTWWKMIRLHRDQPRIATIIRVCADRYGASVGDILSHRRLATIVRPRQIAMFLARQMTGKSLPEIGRCFGGRDHTTVLHAVVKVAGLDLEAELDSIRRDVFLVDGLVPTVAKDA